MVAMNLLFFGLLLPLAVTALIVRVAGKRGGRTPSGPVAGQQRRPTRGKDEPIIDAKWRTVDV
jgi:hypothetical protein